MPKPLHIIKEHLKENLEAGKPFSIQLPIALENNAGRPLADSPWVEFDFRLLTARYLGESGYFLDFSTPGILEKALPLFRLQVDGGVREKPLKYQRNHSFRIEDTLGYSHSVSYGSENGIGQITGVARLHRDLAAREIEMLNSDPPLLESVSLGLNYNWVQSHPKMRFWEFVDLLGHEVDGEIVRIIVTEILEIYHVALVWAGADEKAMRLNAMKLWKEHAADFPDGVVVELSQINKGDDIMNVIIQKLTELLGVDSENKLEAAIRQLMKKSEKVDSLNTEVSELTVKIQDLESDKADLETQIAERDARIEKLESEKLELKTQAEESANRIRDLEAAEEESRQAIADLNTTINDQKPQVDMGQRYIDNLKKDVKGLVGLVMGDLSESMKDLIEHAGPEKLEALRTEFEEKAETLFPVRCQDCGSLNVSSRSSREEKPKKLQESEIGEQQKYSLKNLKK